jgi:hypothetical protein
MHSEYGHYLDLYMDPDDMDKSIDDEFQEEGKNAVSGNTQDLE